MDFKGSSYLLLQNTLKFLSKYIDIYCPIIFDIAKFEPYSLKEFMNELATLPHESQTSNTELVPVLGPQYSENHLFLKVSKRKSERLLNAQSTKGYLGNLLLGIYQGPVLM